MALTLLAVILLPLFGMFPASDVAISDARNYDMAAKFAQSKLEHWTQQGYAAIVARPLTIEAWAAVTLTSTANGVTQSQAINYSVSHSVVVSGAIEQVEAFVYWRQKTGAWSFYQGSRSLSQIRLTTWVTP